MEEIISFFNQPWLKVAWAALVLSVISYLWIQGVSPQELSFEDILFRSLGIYVTMWTGHSYIESFDKNKRQSIYPIE